MNRRGFLGRMGAALAALVAMPFTARAVTPIEWTGEMHSMILHKDWLREDFGQLVLFGPRTADLCIKNHAHTSL